MVPHRPEAHKKKKDSESSEPRVWKDRRIEPLRDAGGRKKGRIEVERGDTLLAGVVLTAVKC